MATPNLSPSALSNEILAGLNADNLRVIKEFSAVVPTDIFVDVVKNLRHRTFGILRNKYYSSLKIFIDETEIPVSAHWQLVYDFIEFNDGWRTAHKWLRDIALKGDDNYAGYVYCAEKLKRGDFQDLVDNILRLKMIFSNDKKLDLLLFLMPFYSGKLTSYNDIDFTNIKLDPFYLNVAMKICFVRREFDSVIKLYEGYASVSNSNSSLYLRSKHALANPGLLETSNERNILVIGADRNSARSQRFNYSAHSFGLQPIHIDAVDGTSIPKILKESYLPGYNILNDRDKTFGSFVSHLKAWEIIVKDNMKDAVICEDDCIFILNPFHVIDKLREISSFDILFLNNRMMPRNKKFADHDMIAEDATEIFNNDPRTIGADCYYMSVRAAEAAIQITREKQISDVVDKFILFGILNSLEFRPKAAVPAATEHVDEQYMFE